MTERPGYGPDQTMRGLALPRRIGYAAAGLAGLCGATLIGMLWATEPGELPARTQVAFAALVLIGVAWAVFAAAALVRGPLFAVDRVVAAWLAVVFSALATAGMLAIAVTRASAVGVVAAVTVGPALVGVAAATLVRARAYRAALLVRMRELETHASERSSS